MERIGDEVDRVLSRTGGGQATLLSRILAVWVQAVGEPVSRQAWPLRVGRDGTLHVATASSTWAYELDRLSPEIMRSLTGALGEDALSGLRFRVGPIPEPGPALDRVQEKAYEAAANAPEAAAAADAAAAAIDDPELRELVVRAARASLAE